MNNTDRDIVRLAVPAFFALIAEPLFLLADTAFVGHLGTSELAGVGVASVILQTVVGLCVFLAYGTTASVARKVGAGDTRSGLAQGIDGLWLAVGLGIGVTAALLATRHLLIDSFGVTGPVAAFADDYLSVALLGITPLLMMLAATGVLRGLQDTTTPLWVAVVGNLVNIVANYLLVFGPGPLPSFGVAGAAWGTVVIQAASAAALTLVVVRAARSEQTTLRPRPRGIREAGRASVPLVIRTLALRAALLVGAWAVASTAGGEGTEVAAHQIAFTVWTFLVFALDAIAIAAQALTGHSLGAGDRVRTRELTRRMVRWGWWSGVVCGALLAATSPWLGRLFTPDDAVLELVIPLLLIAAVGQPLAGVVFVLDGVLIGAGDGAYLAWGGLAVLAIYAPVVLLVASTTTGTQTLIGVWVAFSALFMGARAVVLIGRSRGEKWMMPSQTPPEEMIGG